MVAYKTKWSILVLEDEPGLRELLQSNFTSLLGDACQVDFAASICQAVHKTKAQMAVGRPYDVFWVDLVLDYFSYDNSRGEIVSAKSVAEIIDTERLQRELKLEQLSPAGLATALELPANKRLEAYSTSEKLQFLGKISPYCLDDAKPCFQTLLELLQTYFHSDHHNGNLVGAENTYARKTIDFVFSKFSDWAANQEKQFTLRNDDFDMAAPEIDEMAIHDATKSKQSWTVFRDYVRELYDGVAHGDREHQAYSAANPLLVELKNISPRGYPQFFVNSAYGGERQKMLEAAAVYNSNDTIVAEIEFKGTSKDAALAAHLAQIFSRLRRLYFEIKSKRRGASHFLIAGKYLDRKSIGRKNWNPNEIIFKSAEYQLEFTAGSFFPDLLESLYQVRDKTPELVEEIQAQVTRDLEISLRNRAPVSIQRLVLEVPANFFTNNWQRGKFLLYAYPEGAKAIPVELTFDEGRWLFFELCCRKWFPKCFFVHSRWKAPAVIDKHGDYFLPAKELLTKSIKRAALERPELFQLQARQDDHTVDLPETASFYHPEADYASSFDWTAFFSNFLQTNSTTRQALALLEICKELTVELKARKITGHLLKPQPITISSLLSVLENPAYVAIEAKLQQLVKLISVAEKENPRLIETEYLPGIKNWLAVTLCFYALPAKPAELFFQFWRERGIPNTGVRPIEKFVLISDKLPGLAFKKSLELPVAVEGKNNFLFVPTALNSNQIEIVVKSPIATGSDLRLNDLSCQKFVDFFAHP